MSLLTGLTESYNLDGNSNANFGSKNGTDTAITYSAGNGKIGQGAGFNGTSSQILIGNGTGVDNIFATGGTFANWIKPTAFSNTYVARLAEKRSGAGGWIISFDQTAGSTSKVSFDVMFSGTNGTWNTTAAVISTGSYTSVMVTYNGSSTANVPIIYINGSSVALTTVSSPVGTISSDVGVDLVLGNATTSSRWYSGAMDITNVWTSLLSASDATAFYNGGIGIQYPFGNSNSFFEFM